MRGVLLFRGKGLLLLFHISKVRVYMCLGSIYIDRNIAWEVYIDRNIAWEVYIGRNIAWEVYIGRNIAWEVYIYIGRIYSY